MSQFRAKPTDQPYTPVKSPSKQKYLSYTATRPTRDTQPDDPQRYIKIIRGLTVLINLFSKKRPTSHALTAISETAVDNDCLFPAAEDVAILTMEEKQQWDNMIEDQGAIKAALVAGRFLSLIESFKQRETTVFSSLKDIYFEVKDEKQTQFCAVLDILRSLFNRRVGEGWKQLKAVKGNKKIEAINRRLIVQFVKMINSGLKRTCHGIYESFLNQIKEVKRIHHQNNLNTLRFKGNALLTILKPHKDLDIKSAYFKWFLKTAPGERQLRKVADTLALYDKINYQTAGWRLFRLKPKKIEINLQQKRKTLLFGQILNRLLLQRLSNSLTNIIVSGFQSKKLDVVRRMMICALRKRYLAFNVWHRKIIKYKFKNNQTHKITKINEYFAKLSSDSLSNLGQTFNLFKKQLQIGQKKKVDAIQQIANSKNGEISKMINIWKSHIVSLRVQKESGQIIKCFQSLNNQIRSGLNKVFGNQNLTLSDKKRNAFEKLFGKINGRKGDTLNIWRQHTRVQKQQQLIDNSQKVYRQKIQSLHAKSLIDIVNEMKRQKFIEAMKKFRQNQDRKKQIRRILQSMIKSRSDSVSTAFKKISELRFSKKGVLSNQTKVQNSVKLSEFLTKITSIRIIKTFKSFTSEVQVGRQHKQKIVHRLISVTNQLRKRLYGRWSKIIIEDQNTQKNKNVNSSFELLFTTIRGLASNAIYHNNQRRKKQHALVRIFRNLMLNENLAFHQWNKITVQRLLVKEKKGKKKYIQALKMVVNLGLLFKNRQKDVFDKIQDYSQKVKAQTSSRGAIFYNGLVYLIKHNLRKSFRRFLDNNDESDIRKLKLLLILRDYAFLNEEKALTIWRELSKVKQESKITQQEISKISEQQSVESAEVVVKRTMVSSLEGQPKTLRHKIIYQSRKEYEEDD